jgi:hypothetical protein
MFRTLPLVALVVAVTACDPTPAEDDRKYCDVVATEVQGGTTGTGVDIDGDGWLTICLRAGIVTLTTEH